MFINGARIAHVKYPDKGKPGGKRTDPTELNIGCRKNRDGTYVDFAYGEFDEMTVWMWALAEDQEHFYLGGHGMVFNMVICIDVRNNSNHEF